MATVTLVAAVADNGVIGQDGDVPWHLPEDLRRTKERTMGHVLVMGRTTFDSIGRPLPGRTSVVVTSRPAGLPDGVLVAPDTPSALRAAAALDDDVIVFGGARVYADALPHADRMEISHVPGSPDGDTRFPDVDWSQWREVSRTQHAGYALAVYERVSPPRGAPARP